MRIAVAGTFGPIHDGHRVLFEHALEFGEDGVVVALTSDELAVETRHEPRPIPRFEKRKRRVAEEFAALDEWGRDIEIRTLEDELDIASSDPSLDGLVLSPETAPELEAINDRRRDRDLEPLTGIVAPYALAEDGERISSTRVVNDEIDEHGRVLE
ncbi:phosphopantetheine adenylyltransferase [Natrialbaceae archaeon AArc-T1-2]|uniref:phosphopantetheine adenylyltransferase n=1 Tax=Natrialbaceae archaeon AArc-T1-2 TaxID=3053904 RepID=UPI00255B0278|nr:pantetheine-phosphate adenylyltransferase [Natrialbaceae archaeon AArc-T1-2]WIV68364.1 pantetheine-phosphate adenylyltransferase [Natrialbaceae archaeon AArc-T1-2]